MKLKNFFLLGCAAIAFCSLSVVACKKTDSTEIAANSVANYTDEQDLEVDDSNPEDFSEDVDYTSEAVTPIVITAVTGNRTGSFRQTDFPRCQTSKYDSHIRLPFNEGVDVTVTGSGFIDTVGGTPRPIELTATIKINKVDVPFDLGENIDMQMNTITMPIKAPNDSLKNTTIKLKFTKRYDKGVLLATPKVKTKTIKVVGVCDSRDADYEATYGTAAWEIIRQRLAMNLVTDAYSYDTDSTVPLDSTYIPTVGTTPVAVPSDQKKIAVGTVLTSNTNRLGIIKAIAAADKKGFYKITIWERNGSCNNLLKKYARKFKAGAFSPTSSDGHIFTKVIVHP